MTLEHFRDLVLVQLSTSAADELFAKYKTRKVEASNARLKEQIVGKVEFKSRLLKDFS